jgi:hypothetical protein
VQTTTNEPFVRRRVAIGRWSTTLGFLVLLGGMYISLQQPQRPDPNSITWIVFAPWITLFLGIVLLNVGKYHAMRYGSNPRVDQALASALKGLDHRYHLYSYVPDWPVEHLLATPHGVIVLEPRSFSGEVIHAGSEWKRPMNLKGILQRFAEGGLGNPTREALADAEAVHQMLRERLGDAVGGSISVFPIIVMTNPRIKLNLSNPDVPVVTIGNVRSAVRQIKDANKLTATVQRQLVRALHWDPPHQALSTTRSNT